MTQTTPNDTEVEKEGTSYIKNNPAFIIISKNHDGSFDIACKGMTKENLAWSIVLIQKELLR